MPYTRNLVTKKVLKSLNAGAARARSMTTPCEKKWEDCAEVDGFKVGTIYYHADKAHNARRAEQIAQNIKIGEDIQEPITPTILTLDEMLTRLVWVGSAGLVVDKVSSRARTCDVAKKEYAASVHRRTRWNFGCSLRIG